MEKIALQEKEENSVVCFCYRQTTKMLREAYAQTGSLRGVEELTRAGTGCTGCKIILQSLFGEAPSEHYQIGISPELGSSCKKPGNRVMKCFVIADGDLESTVYSSNAVAPQFGNCDADTDIAYALLDHRGVPVLQRTGMLKTNETFIFETAKEDLPRPFYGMFLLAFGRSNYGASRFNVYWGNKKSHTSTHENSNTGRPRVTLPVTVDKNFLASNNKIFAALTNPHERKVAFDLIVKDLDSTNEMTWHSELPPHCSMWIDANQFLYGPALAKFPEGRFVLKLFCYTDMYSALAMYFFIHNQTLDLWTVNHL